MPELHTITTYFLKDIIAGTKKRTDIHLPVDVAAGETFRDTDPYCGGVPTRAPGGGRGEGEGPCFGSGV